MIRVGFYTGNVYSQEDYNNHIIKECCIVANPCMTMERSIKDAKEKAEYKKILNCGTCHQCEASKN
jgi:hypothetical protein